MTGFFFPISVSQPFRVDDKPLTSPVSSQTMDVAASSSLALASVLLWLKVKGKSTVLKQHSYFTSRPRPFRSDEGGREPGGAIQGRVRRAEVVPRGNESLPATSAHAAAYSRRGHPDLSAGSRSVVAGKTPPPSPPPSPPRPLSIPVGETGRVRPRFAAVQGWQGRLR